MSEKNFDAIVVGGGIIGCTSAYFLARRGLNVALVEQHRLAGGTTGSSFAWINATSKTADGDYHRLNALGLAGYCELAVEFGETRLGINPAGALRIVRKSDTADHAAARVQAHLLADFGYPSAWIGPDALRLMEPHLALPEDAEALYSMADLCLDAPRFARFMAGQLRALGGAVFEGCAARSLEAGDDGRISGLMTDAGRLKSEIVLLAAGPGTPEVLAALMGHDAFAARFPVRRVPGLLVTTPSTSPHSLVRHVVYLSGVAELHILPDFNGGLKIGADQTDGMVEGDTAPDTLRQAARILLNRAKGYLPGFPGQACLDDCRLTVGDRPYPEDGHSLAGALPGAQGLFVVATHSGITLAPALGRLMAELIVTGQTPGALAPFSLRRLKGFA